ncbi:hypothetical protein BH23PLA1_BH23PLA1_19100 [soil metagenome]
MATFFLLCAIFGGTILLIQVALALLGFGSDSIGDHGGGLGGDHGGLGGDHGGTGGDHGGTGGDHGSDHGSLSEVGHGGMAYLAKIVTFQTIVAFLAFFGLGGLVGLELDLRSGGTITLATGAGIGAMVLTAYCYSWLRALHGEGTLQMRDATGATGVVYLRIPCNDGGIGNATIVIQGRTFEVAARTPGPELRTGEKLVVSRVIDDRTVEVVAEAAYLAKAVSLSD